MRATAALAVMAVASIALGWLVAGRALRPIQTITAATREISDQNLHARLALAGPRDELKQLGDTIDGLLARLEHAFDAQRSFVANASHELRTPLAGIRVSVDVARRKSPPVSADTLRLADQVREDLDQADRFVDSFLTLARVQRGVMTDVGPLSLPAVITDILDLHADAFATRRLHVEKELCDALVTGNELLVRRLAANLVDNAIRHNEPGGFVRIRTAAEAGLARLVVSNGGPLLDEAAVARLGQPFQRLGSERTGSDDGLGLGLSIAAAIAHAHGGRLGLAARADGGLRVTAELPQRVLPDTHPDSAGIPR